MKYKDFEKLIVLVAEEEIDIGYICSLFIDFYDSIYQQEREVWSSEDKKQFKKRQDAIFKLLDCHFTGIGCLIEDWEDVKRNLKVKK